MSRYGTIGYDLGRVGRWARVGSGLLIAAGAAASTVIGLDEVAEPGAFLLQMLVYLAAITVAYLLAYLLLGERLFARANPWLNTLILVGPALLIAYWNLTLEYALGAELPAPLVVAMLAYVAASFLIQAAIGYGGCEVVALPILVFRRRYVSYCLPIVMIDAAERGWMDSSGMRRGVWVALGLASLVTVTLGLTRVGPPLLSGLAFVVVAVLVATLTYLDRRATRLRDRAAAVPADAAD